MPIKDLQQRLTQVGVIRLGEQRLSKNNKPYPAKLDTFRVTSPSQELVEAVAALYGGKPRPWADGPGGGQWEVVTTVTKMPVFVLPQRIDPNMEMWGPGFRSRMCDGETERIRNCPCICDADRQQTEANGQTWVRDGRKHCKPTTRVSVMLADIPSLGTWKVESHGWNAAAELPTLTLAILAQAQRPVPASLEMKFHEDRRLTFRDGKEELETFKFAVPHLDFGDLGITPRQSLGSGVDAFVRDAVAGGPQRQAIGSGPTPQVESPRRNQPAAPSVDWLGLIAKATTTDALNKLRGRLQSAGVRDQAVVDAWSKRSRELTPAANQQGPAVTAPTGEVVDAEVEPDRDETWTAIMREAKKLDWNLPVVEEKYRAQMGHDPADDDLATGFKLAAFLDALKSGAVQ